MLARRRGCSRLLDPLANAWVKEPFLGFRMSHAAVVETSLMMALHPQSVDLQQLPPVPESLRYQDFDIVDAEAWEGDPKPDYTLRSTGDPRVHASPELGWRFIERAVNELEGVVRAELQALGWSGDEGVVGGA